MWPPARARVGAQGELASVRGQAQAASERAAAAEARVQRLETEADALARQVATLQVRGGGPADPASCSTGARGWGEGTERTLLASCRAVGWWLQEKLGKGEFGAESNVRVLHLRLNPEAEHHKQVRRGQQGARKGTAPPQTALRAAAPHASRRRLTWGSLSSPPPPPPPRHVRAQAAQSQAGALQAQVEALSASLAHAQGALEAMERRALLAEQQLQASGGGAPGSQGRGVAGALADPAAPGGGAGGGGLGGGAAALLQRVSGLEGEVAALRHKLGEADKASRRLKEVFKERAAAFREAVYQLFGYRSVASSDNRSVAHTPRSPHPATTTTCTPTPRPPTQHAQGGHGQRGDHCVRGGLSTHHLQPQAATRRQPGRRAALQVREGGHGAARTHAYTPTNQCAHTHCPRRFTAEEGMQLVPTPFTSGRLAREVDTFVRRFKCIPALTANLTMESFQKQTQC